MQDTGVVGGNIPSRYASAWTALGFWHPRHGQVPGIYRRGQQDTDSGSGLHARLYQSRIQRALPGTVGRHSEDGSASLGTQDGTFRAFRFAISPRILERRQESDGTGGCSGKGQAGIGRLDAAFVVAGGGPRRPTATGEGVVATGG